jgi:hypothetical protein
MSVASGFKDPVAARRGLRKGMISSELVHLEPFLRGAYVRQC